MKYNLTKYQLQIYNQQKVIGGSINTICGCILLDYIASEDVCLQAVNKIYEINDMLRVKITEKNGTVQQEVKDFVYRNNIAIKKFRDESELKEFADKIAGKSFDFDEELCTLYIIYVNNKCGLLGRIHHIISDAWTFSLLGIQFANLIQGKPVEAYNYIDLCEEKEISFAKRIEVDKDFFISEYNKVPNITLLSNKDVSSYKSLRKSFFIKGELYNQINALEKKYNCSKYNILFVAIQILMYKLNRGVDSFFLGTAVLNRFGKKEKNTAGMFVTVHPVFSEVNENDTYGTLIEKFKTKIFEVFRHHNYTYSDLLNDLRSSGIKTGPLYDVMISYQNANIELGIPSKTIWFANNMQTETLCINIDDRDNQECLNINYDFLIDRLSESDVILLNNYFENIIRMCYAQEEICVGEIRLQSEEEEKALTARHEGAKAEYPEGKTIAELFEEQVKKSEGKTAIEEEGGSISYGELNRKANRIAHWLRERGIKKEERVGISGKRGIEIVAGMLGILKAGGAYVPADPEYPEDRIRYMMEDSGARLILCDEEGYKATEKSGKERILIREAESEREDNPEVINDGKSLAYIIYTSGTTGQPKGAMLEQNGVVNYITWAIKQYVREGKENGFAFHSSISFDLTVTSIYVPLLSGNRIITITSEDKSRLIEKIEEDERIGIVKLTPTHLKVMKENGKRGKNIHTMILGGENLTGEVCRGIEEKYNHEVTIYNEYGPTETVVGCMIYRYDEAKDINNVSIGKPIDNENIYIVDRNGKLCPEGVSGELWIGGEGVGRGYINKEEISQEKFIESPWKEGERIYKSGDLGRWNEEGNIEYLGRIDEQVKIRGYRIEIGEIEAAIESQKGVKGSCVVVEEKGGVKSLVGYIAVEEETDYEEFKQKLSERLPEYMIPGRFIEVEEIPLTKNGKVDKRKLKEKGGKEVRSSEYEAPEGETEEKLAEIWKEVLGVEKVGRNDSFFEIGGDSIKAIQVVSRLNNEGLGLEIKDIFEQKTIKAIGAIVRKAGEEVKYEHIKRVAEKEWYATTTEQQQIYIEHERAGKGNINYNMPVFLRLKGKVNVEGLKKAFEKIEERHESLRTNYRLNEKGELEQKINKEGRIKVEVKKVREEEIEEQKRAFVRWFDLSKDSLIRVEILETENEVVLCTDMHHIAADGVSTSLIIKDLSEIYRGEEKEKPEIRYADYAEWQKGEEYSRRKEAAEKYWEEVYEEPLEEMELITSGKGNGKGKVRTYKIGTEKRRRIEEYCRGKGLTAFMFYYEAITIMLSKISGQEDVVVGVVEAGRKEREIENVIGMFVNTLAMRARPEGTKEKEEYEREIKAGISRAFDRNECSLKEISKYAGREGKTLFEVMFAWQNIEGVGSEYLEFGEGIEVETEKNEVSGVKFGLTIQGSRKGAEDIFEIDYEEGRYSDELIDRYWKWLEKTAEGIIDEGTKRIGEIRLQSEEEEKALTARHEGAKAEYPEGKTIAELFEEQVKKSEGKTAIEEEGGSISYGELNRKANRIAHWLRERGIKKEERVGISGKRGIEIVAGMLGILKAGGAYVPADPEYPEDRIRYMMEDSGARLILCDEEGYKATEKSGKERILIREAESEREDNPEVINDGKSLAYIIYTSGTTGQPKGAMIEHKSLVNTVYAYKDIFLKKDENRMLQMASISFDASVFEIFSCIIHGNSLYIASKEQKNDIHNLIEFVEEKKINIVFMPTAYMNVVLKERYEIPECVEILLTAGDLLRYGIKNERYKLYNLYGPTEDTIWSTYAEAEENMPPIGKPIYNKNIYIVDRNGKLCPEGVSGELWIGGEGVGRGYINKEEISQEKFIESPWKEGERIYKSGDLGRWNEEGNIEYLGRIDEQVKIRGYRIEIGEIEAAIESQKGVKGSCVVVEEKGGVKSLVGYIAVEEETDYEEFKQKLSERLPEYMIPGRFIEVEEIPLTKNGKVDKRKLKEKGGKEVRSSEYEAPEGETEEKLAEIWKEVLGVEKVGRNDSFFEIGGDSIKAIQVVSRLNNEGLGLEIKDIFEQKTIKAIGAIVRKAGEEVKYEHIKRVAEKEWYATTTEQQQIYIEHERAGKGNINYNMPVFLRLKGKVNVEGLKKAFEKIEERHESLRTNYRLNEKGELEQKINKEGRIKVEVKKVREEEIEEQKRAFVRWFDLSKDSLIRVEILETENEVVLCTDMHHIAADGVSTSLIIKDLSEIYRGEEKEKPEIRYADYAEWQKGEEYSRRKEAAEKYWEEVYEEPLEEMELITSGKGNGKGKVRTYKIGTEKRRRIEEYCRGKGLTAFMFYYEAITIMLSKISGQEDVVVGVVEAGRKEREIENVIGMFVNTLAMRARPEGTKEKEEYEREIKAGISRAFDRNECSLKEISKYAGREGKTLFEVMFAWQNIEGVGSEYLEFGEGIEVETEKNEVSGVKFGLTIQGSRKGAEDIFEIDYEEGRYSDELIDRYWKWLEKTAEGIIDEGTKRIGEIRLQSEEEEKALTARHEGAKAEYPEGKTIAELFEEQVKKSEGKTAIEEEGGSISYGELNRKANRIAHWLRERGIKKEERVGISGKRGIEIVAGMLGILKAGGAYVPADPEYPEDRIRYMMEDSGARLILCDEEGYKATEKSGKERILIREAESEREDNPEVINDGKSLAYIIYTSGTTGQPKGAMLEQNGVVNYITWAIKQYVREGKENGFAFHSSISFDLTVTSIYVPLLSGNRIITITSEDKSRLIEKIEEDERIGIVKLTPTHLKVMKENGKRGKNIHTMILGGENLTGEVCRGIEEKYNHEVTIYNEYGPTETVVGCMIYRYDEAKDINNVSIGKPIDNENIYIVDRNGKLCPEGVSGELWIGGEGVGRGYINKEEISQEKFIESPWKEGERIYKSGDLGRWNEEGNIEYLGRIDEQVKIRGYRIEIGEIEAAIESQKGVKGSCVVVEEKGGVKSLVGYIAVEEETDYEEFKQKLSERLPEYMIPGRFIEVEEIPLTKNGKVDKRKLKEKGGKEVRSSEYEAPEGETEEKLAEIWKEVLGVEKVGRNDSFFEIGGDSIKAIQVVSRLNNEGLGLEIKDIFEQKTIKAIAECVQIAKYEEIKVRTGETDLSPVQKWFFKNWKGNINYYNQGIVLESLKKIDIEILKKVILEIYNQYDIFRTIYKKDSVGNWISYILEEPLNYDFIHYIKTSEDPKIVLRKEIEPLYKDIDIEKGKLIQICIVEGNTTYIGVLIHHLAIDGVSWRILVDQIYRNYKSVIDDKQISPIHYIPFQKWVDSIKEYKTSDSYIKNTEYWKRNLDFDYIHLERCNIKQNKRIHIDKELSDYLLNELYKESNVTVHELLVCALVKTMCHFYGIRKAKIMMESHGREEELIKAKINSTVGWFTSMFPVRFDTSDITDDFDLLWNVRNELSKVPDNGLGYLIGEYEEDIPVCFNFLGDLKINNTTSLRPTNVDLPSFIDPDGKLFNAITINGYASENGIELDITSDLKDGVKEFTEKYEQSIHEIIDVLNHKNKIVYVAEDFTSNDISFDDLKIILGD
ncbi:amino acid adenylation domain-containing protein [Treponema bryantii]|uniref:amino acid adenylation domain-containing protein n=1 Tax=Treponema bryantii TaxID=163 RepID=UPI002B2D7440|nr:surfactin synthase subunit 1 [Treponema bryantii]